jgi:hypothetical protein
MTFFVGAEEAAWRWRGDGEAAAAVGRGEASSVADMGQRGGSGARGCAAVGRGAGVGAREVRGVARRRRWGGEAAVGRRRRVGQRRSGERRWRTVGETKMSPSGSYRGCKLLNSRRPGALADGSYLIPIG